MKLPVVPGNASPPASPLTSVQFCTHSSGSHAPVASAKGATAPLASAGSGTAERMKRVPDVPA